MVSAYFKKVATADKLRKQIQETIERTG